MHAPPATRPGSDSRRPRRLRRRLATILAAASALAVLAPAGDAAAQGPAPDLTAAATLLRSAPCPRYISVRTVPRRPEREADALRGRFWILDHPIRLVPPVNWAQDPYHSVNWKQTLQQWVWMDPLLARWGVAGNSGALARARDLALNWIARNPVATWSDKVTADRAGYLAYLMRAAGCRRVLSAPQAKALLASAQQHGEFLANPANHGSGNHALFVDAGLILLTGYLPFLPQAAEWRALAEQRFRTALGQEVQSDEGVDLEHSPGYHFKVYDLVNHVLAFPGGHDPALVRLRDQMRRVAPWFVMPDGIVTPLGDTAYEEAPQWVRGAARRTRGLAPTLKSGYGIVKLPGSYLSVTDQVWPNPHGQADQLSFELWDRGRRIITDTGRYGFLRDYSNVSRVTAEEYTKSSQAHSVLTVDGRNFRTFKPFGSGLHAAGQGAGWYAIEGTNPPLSPQLGVEHDRLFLYRPGQALIVVDRIQSETVHTYARYLQFDPAFQPAAGGRVLPMRAGRFTAYLYDAPTAGEGPRSAIRGRRSPLLGWVTSSNKFESFVPRSTLLYRSRGSSLNHVMAIGLGGRVISGVLPPAGDVFRLRVQLPGRPATVLDVARAGDRLTVS